MSVFLAQNSGFCFGVKRAIKLALEASEQSSGQTIFTLGELIHNPQIVEELRSKNILIADRAQDLHNVVVIIRSHGISLQDEELLKAQACTLIDATCPYVKRTHELVAQMSKEAYQVIVCGDANHPEVKGMVSYGQDVQVLCPTEGELPSCGSKLAVICQTTQKVENLQNLVSNLLLQAKELRVFNTICLATAERQDATEALAKVSDLMIVIGGKNSSNTRMLDSICSKETHSVHIETELELDRELIRSSRRIGLSAGASTPDKMIQKVYNKIKEIKGEDDTANCIGDIPTFKEESC